MSLVKKKLFKHGGSYAIDLPMSFVKKSGVKEMLVDTENLTIFPKKELDTLESEPLFAQFIHALVVDVMKHPKKLRDSKEVWDKEWDELLKGVSGDDK